jgi:hypothetical protein
MVHKTPATLLFGELVTLVDGSAEKKVTLDSVSLMSTNYLGNE